jgi:hypothetical protein
LYPISPPLSFRAAAAGAGIAAGSRLMCKNRSLVVPAAQQIKALWHDAKKDIANNARYGILLK